MHSDHSRFPINFPKLLSRGRYIFDGVKQIEERNNEFNLTRSTLHIMGRHKLQCTEAAIHHTGVYIPWLIACWRNCTQWSKPLVDQPIREVKEKRKRETERERKDHRAEKVETFGSHLPSRIQCID